MSTITIKIDGTDTFIRTDLTIGPDNSKLIENPLNIYQLKHQKNAILFLVEKIDNTYFYLKNVNEQYMVRKNYINDKSFNIMMSKNTRVHSKLKLKLKNNYLIYDNNKYLNSNGFFSINFNTNLSIEEFFRIYPDISKINILSNDFDINSQDNLGNTLLHYICIDGNLDDYILNKFKNMDINIQNNNGKTCLFYCSDNNDNIEKLINFFPNIDLNIQDNDGNTALMCQIYDLSILNVKILIDNKASINITNNKGQNALHYLINIPDIIEIDNRDDDYKEITNYLINNIRNINVKTNNGETAFYLACERNQYIVEFFCDNYLAGKINKLDMNIGSNSLYPIEIYMQNYINNDIDILYKFVSCLPDFNIIINGSTFLTKIITFIGFDSYEKFKDIFQIVLENSDLDLKYEGLTILDIYLSGNPNKKIKKYEINLKILNFIEFGADIKGKKQSYSSIINKLMVDILSIEPLNIDILERRQYRGQLCKEARIMLDKKYEEEKEKERLEIERNAIELQNEEILEKSSDTVYDLLEIRYRKIDDFLTNENNIIFVIEGDNIGLSRENFINITDDKIIVNCDGIGWTRVRNNPNRIEYVNMEAFGILLPSDNDSAILIEWKQFKNILSNESKFYDITLREPEVIITSAGSLELMKNSINNISRLHCQGNYFGLVYDISIHNNLN
jgi:hypothetical protein